MQRSQTFCRATCRHDARSDCGKHVAGGGGGKECEARHERSNDWPQGGAAPITRIFDCPICWLLAGPIKRAVAALVDEFVGWAAFGVDDEEGGYAEDAQLRAVGRPGDRWIVVFDVGDAG